MIIKAAFATDDGNSFIKRHFGDAEYFLIYEITEDNYRLIKKIANSTEEEKTHADPDKARGIVEILVKENVNTAVSFAFGSNIKRIRKKFVCVLVDDIPIETAVRTIRENSRVIEGEWLKGEGRGHISLKE